MFEDEEFLESRTFQHLHKIVLGLSNSSLEDQLLLCTSNINDTDTDGRTALSWAATRGDLGAVTTLLRFGADTCIPSHWSQTPLHFATQNKKESMMPILQELIKNGAEVNAIDYWNRTALIYASGNHASIAPLQLLFEHGTALDVRDRRLRIALGYAARLGNCQHAQYLLMSGANPQLADEFNVLPLLEAVKNNYHDIIRLLLPVSNPLQIEPYDSSLLHWVATYGDNTTMDILQEYPSDRLFHSFEVFLINKEGLTPQNLFEQRSKLLEQERNTFHALIQMISERGQMDLTDELEIVGVRSLP